METAEAGEHPDANVYDDTTQLRMIWNMQIQEKLEAKVQEYETDAEMLTEVQKANLMAMAREKEEREKRRNARMQVEEYNMRQSKLRRRMMDRERVTAQREANSAQSGPLAFNTLDEEHTAGAPNQRQLAEVLMHQVALKDQRKQKEEEQTRQFYLEQNKVTHEELLREREEAERLKKEAQDARQAELARQIEDRNRLAAPIEPMHDAGSGFMIPRDDNTQALRMRKAEQLKELQKQQQLMMLKKMESLTLEKLEERKRAVKDMSHTMQQLEAERRAKQHKSSKMKASLREEWKRQIQERQMQLEEEYDREPYATSLLLARDKNAGPATIKFSA
jgi:hypothetical protein